MVPDSLVNDKSSTESFSETLAESVPDSFGLLASRIVSSLESEPTLAGSVPDSLDSSIFNTFSCARLANCDGSVPWTPLPPRSIDVTSPEPSHSMPCHLQTLPLSQ